MNYVTMMMILTIIIIMIRIRIRIEITIINQMIKQVTGIGIKEVAEVE